MGKQGSNATKDAEVIAPFQSHVHDHGQCVADAISAAETRCAEDGSSFTPLRREVLELVWSSHGPIGAYELLEKLRDSRRNAAPPTVYRALDFLMEHGLIHRIESLNAYIGCGDPERHHGAQFLICRDCQSVAELDDKAIGRAVTRRADALGFDVEQQTVEVIGQCADCSAREPDDRK
ncbi:MAG: transcriptional repressor [Alphaproteobacteria bacterium]|nr:transcriptional repressor [Alphaproteobacteria bacterium]